MKKFINSPTQVVNEMLDGLVVLDPRVKRLSGHNVVIAASALERRDSLVAVISGGGSGHEPAHAGYVGSGMLSAAVAGEVFTSPSTEAVYAAIRAVAGKAGALLVVKNYTGDRLNFGLAAEMARGEGIPVEMVIVADDVALDSTQQTAGARGIAGTVLIHKIAGAAAASGASLEAVKSAAEEAIDSLGSMGVSFSAGTSPMVGKPSFVLADDEMEVGLGIHGEPGVRRGKIQPADTVVDQILDRILSVREWQKGEHVAVLVNSLGATTPMELAILAGRTMAFLEEKGIVVERFYSGALLTSLDMAGMSLSLLSVDQERLQLLDSPTEAVAWPNVPKLAPLPLKERSISSSAQTSAVNASAAKQDIIQVNGAHLRRTIEAVCSAVIEAEPKLTEMDRQVGDGDLGVSLERGAKAILASFDSYPIEDLAGAIEAISHTVREVLGGTSGPLYGVLLLRLAHSLRTRKSLSLGAWAEAVTSACEAMSALGGAKAGDRTMLDALFPFAHSLRESAAKQVSLRDAVEDAINAAEAGAEATASMVPRRGRSSYLGQRAVGQPDPGAIAIGIELRALFVSCFK